MPRDGNPPAPGAGPEHAGWQPDAIYCPLCASHLRAVPSLHEPALTSHSYECEHGHRWEINRFPELEGARPWNGARPNWDRNTGPE
jgi:hypothetical protein